MTGASAQLVLPCLPCRNDVERHAQGRGSNASWIPQKGLADDVEGYAMLQRDAANDGGILGGGIAIAADLAVIDENLGQIAVFKAADGRRIGEAITLKVECYGGAALR